TSDLPPPASIPSSSQPVTLTGPTRLFPRAHSDTLSITVSVGNPDCAPLHSPRLTRHRLFVFTLCYRHPNSDIQSNWVAQRIHERGMPRTEASAQEQRASAEGALKRLESAA